MNDKNDLLNWNHCIYKMNIMPMSGKYGILEKIKVYIKKKLIKIGIEETSTFYNYLKYAISPIILGIFLRLDLFDRIILVINSFTNILSKAGESSIDHSIMFSTSAAIVSTVFTIIFVLLTLFIQMSGEYTSSDIFKSKETKNLMRLYAGTAIFSLMMLESTCQFPILVFTLTSICISSIYPFLQSINSKLVYDVGIRKLNKEISALIDSNEDFSDIDIKLSLLGNIAKRSISDDQHFDPFLSAMNSFKNNTQKAKQQKMVEVIERIGIHYSVFLDRLIEDNSITATRRRMIMLLFTDINSYINDYSEMISCESLYLQTDSLKEAGIKIIKAGFHDEYANRIVGILCNTFFSIQNKRDAESEIECLEYRLEPDIVEHIGTLAIESFNSKLEVSSLIAAEEALFAMGAKAYQVKEKIGRSEPSASSTIVGQLKKIEDKIGIDNFERLFNEFKNSKKYISREPELEQYRNKFKMYYNKQKIYLN